MERIRKRLISNQLNAAERTNNESNSAFAAPDHAGEDKEKEDAETFEAKTVAPLIEQRAEELTAATTPPQPKLPLTSLQKLETAYGTALHHSNGTHLDGGIANDELW